MKRIAIISDGYVRASQVFTGDPTIISEESKNYHPDWEDQFCELKHSAHYIGLFEGINEEAILNVAAVSEGVHPGIITLINAD